MIPLATTTVTITRVPNDPARDGFDAAPDAVTVASGVRAHVSGPSGSQNITAGDRTVVRFKIDTDPTDLQADDTVIDDNTGDEYRCAWARTRHGLGLDHTVGALEQVTGAST